MGTGLERGGAAPAGAPPAAGWVLGEPNSSWKSIVLSPLAGAAAGAASGRGAGSGTCLNRSSSSFGSHSIGVAACLGAAACAGFTTAAGGGGSGGGFTAAGFGAAAAGFDAAGVAARGAAAGAACFGAADGGFAQTQMIARRWEERCQPPPPHCIIAWHCATASRTLGRLSWRS